MKQQVPLVRNINYPVFFLQLLLVTATIVGFVWLFWPEWGTGSLVGMIVLVVYIKGMQWYLMRYHQAALKLIRAGKYDEALVPLQKALEFYTEHPGLDRWRHVLMATASRFSLREVAMMNIAYCFGQIGDKEKMIKHYERLASEYPDNMAAQNTLRFIDTLQSD